MTHVTCRLTAKNRDKLLNSTLGNRVWATFYLFIGLCGLHLTDETEMRKSYLLAQKHLGTFLRHRYRGFTLSVREMERLNCFLFFVSRFPVRIWFPLFGFHFLFLCFLHNLMVARSGYSD